MKEDFEVDSSGPVTSRLLSDLAIALARGAAELIREAMTESAATGSSLRLDVSSKSTPTDLVTAVDRAVETWLVERIRAIRPHDSILGEEGGSHQSDDDGENVRWVIDPIDGTVNFVRSLPRFAVSIAVEINGITQAGCVLNPVTRELYWAILGAGAWLERGDAPAVQLHGPPARSLGLAIVATGFGYDVARRVRQARVVSDLIVEIADIRRMGSASLDLCSVAAGEIDAYFEVGLSPWDFGAGVLIASEAGCRVSGLRGRSCSTAMTAASSESIAAEFFDLLERVDADLV